MSANLNQAVAPGGVALDLNQLIMSGSFDLAQLSAHLDGLDNDARIAAVRSLSGRAQAQLFEAAQGKRKVLLSDIVPDSTPLLSEVAHYGINSLLMFRTFQKVFCRPEPGAQELWGYNRSGGFVETFVGPGYYVAYETPEGEVLVDYTRLPQGKSDAWPAIIPNEARFGRFVYANMKDALRCVSKHVTIGRAIRNGKVADNWFALCRSEP